MSPRTLRHAAAVLALASLVSLPARVAPAEPRGGRSESGVIARGDDHGFSIWRVLTSLLAKAGVRIDDNGIG